MSRTKRSNQDLSMNNNNSNNNNNQFVINVNEVEKEYILGKGSFGTVYKGKCRRQDVAIKILDKQVLDPETLDSFRREVDIISATRHPNVVQFLGACYVPGNFMIVTEYLPRGDLEEMLLNPKIELSLFTRMKMALDVAKGMNWLHSSTPQFVHRDLKTKNLLIDENNRIKICDFGLSQIKVPGGLLQDPSGKAKGTPLWMAPEVLVGKKFNEKCDVYAYGIILWCLLTRQEPFTEFNDYNTFVNAIVNQRVRPPIPATCEPSLKNLIQACWHSLPSNRPSFSQIIEEIEKILVDVVVKDPVGNHFWKSHHLTQDYITAQNFFDTLRNVLPPEPADEDIPLNLTPEILGQQTDAQLLRLQVFSRDHQRVVGEEFERRYGDKELPMEQLESNDHLNRMCFLALFPQEKKEGMEVDDVIITLERFGFVLSVFGPLVSHNRVTIFDRVRRTLYNKWFHGDIDKNEAEDRIRAQGNKVGTFLIRFSSLPGIFTLSSTSTDGLYVEHRRISYKANESCYIINDNRFPSLEKLIKVASEPLRLTNPCPGSTYQKLFDPTIGGYVGDHSLPGSGYRSWM